MFLISSFIKFVNASEYLSKETAQALMASMRFSPFKLDFKTFLTLLRYPFINFCLPFVIPRISNHHLHSLSRYLFHHRAWFPLSSLIWLASELTWNTFQFQTPSQCLHLQHVLSEVARTPYYYHHYHYHYQYRSNRGGQGRALPPQYFFSEIGHFENSNIFPLDIWK